MLYPRQYEFCEGCRTSGLAKIVNELPNGWLQALRAASNASGVACKPW
jgi:hypothetical protein